MSPTNTIIEKVVDSNSTLLECARLSMAKIFSGDETQQVDGVFTILMDLQMKLEGPDGLRKALVYLDDCAELLYLRSDGYRDGLKMFRLRLGGRTTPDEEIFKPYAPSELREQSKETGEDMKESGLPLNEDQQLERYQRTADTLADFLEDENTPARLRYALAEAILDFVNKHGGVDDATEVARYQLARACVKAAAAGEGDSDEQTN